MTQPPPTGAPTPSAPPPPLSARSPLKRHSALTAPLMALTAGGAAGLTLWTMGERDAYAPPLLSLALWVVWRLPGGRWRRGLRGLMSALYAFGGAALLWERSAPHPVWQVSTDTWALTPESLTLKICAALLALSWITSQRLTPLPEPPPQPTPP